MRGAADSIIARERELEAVARFLDGLKGAPGAILLEGDAGIGKTTLWREAVGAAEHRSYRVLLARPTESESQLAWAALADLVTPAYEETWRRLPRPQQRALDLALLRVEADEPADPRAVAAAFVGVLAALAEASPVVVAVDDVQWLDPASERALEFAARRLPSRVGLLLTRRGGDEGSPLKLSRTIGDDHLERVALGPLSLGSLHHLIRGRLGAVPPRPVLVRIAEASGGNPFFALQIAQALDADPGGYASKDPLPIPPTLQEIVRARVGALSQTAQEAVLVAAAMTRPTAAAIDAALGARGDPGDAIAEAEQAGVLYEQHGQIRFSHPLIASAVYAALPPTRRRRLHQQLADVVADVEDRARHLAIAVTDPDAATAEQLERAAERAARRGAPDAAAALYEASRRLTPAADLDALARRSVAEAASSFAAGDRNRARVVAKDAVETAAGRRRADALILLADIAWSDDAEHAAAKYLHRALAEAVGDDALRGRIHVSLAHYEPAQTLHHANAALTLLDPEREPQAAANALIARLFAEAALGHGASREPLSRAFELEVRAGPAARKSELALIWLVCMDEIEAARSRHNQERTWFGERGLDDWQAERLAFLAVAELHAGRWDVAAHAIDESYAVLEQFEPRGPFALARSFRSLIDAHQGRTDRARATLLPLIEDVRRSASRFWECWLLSTLAFVEFADGDHLAADAAVRRMDELAASLGARERVFDRSEANQIESLVARDEVERARSVLAHLEWRERTLPRPWLAAALPRARALVLAAEQDLPHALAALEKLDHTQASRLPFELARALLVKGTLLRRTRQRSAAREVLRHALATFEDLGAPRWAAQAREELGRIGIRRAPTHLTATERRVAELAATGLTNREVARVAFISPKTVETNLARVYRKLDISSRAELGAHIARQPLSDQPHEPHSGTRENRTSTS